MANYKQKQMKREHDAVAIAKPSLVAGKANPRGTSGHCKRLRKAEGWLKARRLDFERMPQKYAGMYHQPGSMQTFR